MLKLMQAAYISRRALRICLFASAMILAACSREVDVHSGIAEADANEILATLLEKDIKGKKLPRKQGFAVTVPESDLVQAVELLRARGLPRSTFVRMGEIFKKDGMISTPTEERSRYLYALSQELENTLSQIDGVVVARVHPVLSERAVPGELPRPSSCAVFIKHRADFDPGAYEERIRRLVAASIPGLAAASSEIVSVIFVDVDSGSRRPAAQTKFSPQQVSHAELGRGKSGRAPSGERSLEWSSVATVVTLVLTVGLALGVLLFRRYRLSVLRKASQSKEGAS